jgi:hypothetical protein
MALSKQVEKLETEVSELRAATKLASQMDTLDYYVGRKVVVRSQVHGVSRGTVTAIWRDGGQVCVVLQDYQRMRRIKTQGSGSVACLAFYGGEETSGEPICTSGMVNMVAELIEVKT